MCHTIAVNIHAYHSDTILHFFTTSFIFAHFPTVHGNWTIEQRLMKRYFFILISTILLDLDYIYIDLGLFTFYVIKRNLLNLFNPLNFVWSWPIESVLERYLILHDRNSFGLNESNVFWNKMKFLNTGILN